MASDPLVMVTSGGRFPPYPLAKGRSLTKGSPRRFFFIGQGIFTGDAIFFVDPLAEIDKFTRL